MLFLRRHMPRRLGLNERRGGEKAFLRVGGRGAFVKKKGESDLDNFLADALDKEEKQEQQAETHEGSFFENAPDDSAMVARAREFDDIGEHWVRRELWLKTVKRIAKNKGSGVRMLTLPGQHRFEIKLYESENVLEVTSVDGESRLGVVGIEYDPTIFGLLATSEPRLLELLRGDVLAALIEPGSTNGKAIRKHTPVRRDQSRSHRKYRDQE